MSFDRPTWRAGNQTGVVVRVQERCLCLRPLVEVPAVPAAGHVDCLRCKGWTTLSAMATRAHA